MGKVFKAFHLHKNDNKGHCKNTKIHVAQLDHLEKHKAKNQAIFHSIHDTFQSYIVYT